MKTYLFPKNRSFYKTNLHCHTTISDGIMTPEEVKATYMAMGYDAVCFTDHEVLVGHEELCDEHFVALHGYEVQLMKRQGEQTGLFEPCYHFNLIAKRQDTRALAPFDRLEGYREPKTDTEWRQSYGGVWLNPYIKAATDAGFLMNYNHPQWSLQTMEDYSSFCGLLGVEVINGGCFGFNDNTSIHMEILLRRGQNVLPIAGDDNHGYKECGRAFTMICAKSLSYDALIEGLTKGDCYASEAPKILELSLEGNQFLLRTDRPCRAVLLSEGRHIRECDFTESAALEFKPSSAGRYIRFELRDKEGKRAFTRAYDTSELMAAQREGRETL